MKKLLTILTFSVLLVFFIFGLGACDDEKDLQANNISFKTLTVKGDTVYGKVSNETTEFSFLEEISCNDSTQYVVSLDSYGVHTIVTKTVPLIEGDNLFYVIETNEDNITTYTVTIRRRPIYTVRFFTYDGTIFIEEKIEEDELVNVPQTNPLREGYIFQKWDFDFSSPIGMDTAKVITAKWSANEYKVNYNVNGGIGVFSEQKIYYDSDFILPKEKPERTGYDFVGWYYDDVQINNGKWKIAESITLFAKWEAIFTYTTNTITGLTDYGKTHYNDICIPLSIDGIAITTIGSGAFKNCSNVQNIVLTNNITILADNSFSCCPIINIELPNTIIQIGRGAFQSCSRLVSIKIPKSVMFLGDAAFADCSSLKALTFEENIKLENIGTHTFYSCPIMKLDIPLSVTSLGWGAFQKCYALTDLIIPRGMISIGTRAFADCTALKNINIEENGNLESVAGGAFSGCSSLKSITLPFLGERRDGNSKWTGFGYIFGSAGANYNRAEVPKSLETVIITEATEIDREAFYDCIYIKNITIPKCVKSIGVKAFYNCYSLISVLFENPLGWWYNWNASYTSGTTIPYEDLSNSAIAANYLKSNYVEYYWKCET